MFVDRTKITACGGRGGDGCISFRREKYVPKGGPNGGDGGRGGSVILRAATNEQSLVDLHFKPYWQAPKGKNGQGKNCHGAAAKDCILDVPLGTVISDPRSGKQLGDLTEEGQEFVAAKGGAGGKGNTRFVTSSRRAPRISTPGEEGEHRELLLELKTIADVGLVGYPNAGKSTLIAAVSDAHPKTAPYPFTTLHPTVGVVEFEDFHRLTIADVPGLIDGANQNVGLGHEFLRHIERCRVLVYVLDTAGTDGREPWDDFEALQRELELHQPGLSSRPALALANKVDLEEAQEKLATLKKRVSLPMLDVSALEKRNTDAFLIAARKLLDQLNGDRDV